MSPAHEIGDMAIKSGFACSFFAMYFVFKSARAFVSFLYEETDLGLIVCFFFSFLTVPSDGGKLHGCTPTCRCLLRLLPWQCLAKMACFLDGRTDGYEDDDKNGQIYDTHYLTLTLLTRNRIRCDEHTEMRILNVALLLNEKNKDKT